MKGRATRDEIIVQAMAMILEGAKTSDIALALKIDKAIVSRLRKALPKKLQEHITDEQKSSIGDMLVKYVGDSLNTLTAQLKVFSDEEWLKKQSAAEIASVHEVVAANTFRLLEAAEGAGSGMGDGNE